MSICSLVQTYLAVTAVQHDGVILRVEEDRQNRLDRGNGNGLLLGAAHANDVVLDLVGAHKLGKAAVEVVSADEREDALEAELFDKIMVVHRRLATPVNAGNDQAEIERLF
jgi:hypothetical protein